MYESSNKKVQKIIDLIESQGCVIDGKKISLNDLPLVCQNLNDSDKPEIVNLIQWIETELDRLHTDCEEAYNQIQSLEPAKEKLDRLLLVIPLKLQ
jgi:hypothetical protein